MTSYEGSTFLKEENMNTPTLANAELAVMELLWDNGSLTARQIREQLYPDSTKAQHGTVQRLLQRLEEKGSVDRDRTLPIHLFAPRIVRQAYASGQLEALADKLTGGSIAPLITHLVEEKRISAEEIEELRALLNEHNPPEGDAS
jgi:BlaI family transcriptional regulator, penicillinase repressor